jgi:EpsI family protein
MSDVTGRLQPGDKAALLSLVVCVLAIYLGFDTILDRILPRWLGVWDYSHGYLVLGMTAWAISERIREHRDRPLGPSWLGLLVLSTLVLMYALLQQVDFTLGMNLILLPVIGAILWTCGGIRLLRMSVMPLLLLAYAIPFWDRLGQPLQDLATVAVQKMLIASGIPTLAEDNTLRTSRAAVQVAAACSGLTFLLAALTLSTFYATAWLRRLWPGIALVTLSVVVAITSNWVRIYLITIAGHVTDMKHYLIVEDHEFFGWALFSVFMVGLIAIARWVELRTYGPPDQRGNEVLQERANAPIRVLPIAAITVTAAIVLALPVLVRPEAAPERDARILALAGTSALTLSDERRVGWRPIARNPAEELRASISLESAPAYLYVARYPRQQPNGKVAATGHDLESGWSRQRNRSAHRAGLDLQEIELVRGDRRRLVWVWYRVGGRNTASLAQAKVFEVLGVLRGETTGALVAVSVECSITCDGQRSILERFLNSRAADLHLLADKG